MSAIAFFPWFAIEQPLSIGGIRLVPYVRGELPGDQASVAQADIDAILTAYAVQPNEPVDKATLVEIDDWRLGQDPDQVLSRLFTAREAIAFAALSRRSLFQGHFGYCGFHNFNLIVQRFRPGQADTFAFSQRRRDGGTQHLWSSDEFAFHKPLHVQIPLNTISLDAALIDFLMSPALPAQWKEACLEYNRANTDSDDVPAHVEFVMLKSAFELLLDCNTRVEDFESKLGSALPENSVQANGPMLARWSARYPKSTRPIHAWCREFCRLRGAVAHGKAGGNDLVWSEAAHLAFASVLFPLLLRKLAADMKWLTIDQEDLDRLARIEDYLAFDPFAPTDRSAGAEARRHPWTKLEQSIRMATIAREWYGDLLAGIN